MKQPGVVPEPSVHLPSAPPRKSGEDMSPSSTGQISSISVHHHHHLHPYSRSGDEDDDDEDDVVATATEDDIITSRATIPGPVQVMMMIAVELVVMMIMWNLIMIIMPVIV